MVKVRFTFFPMPTPGQKIRIWVGSAITIKVILNIIHCRRSKRTFEPLMHVSSDGLVMTVPSVEVEVDCSIDTTAFPYDAQRCELEVIIIALMNNSML